MGKDSEDDILKMVTEIVAAYLSKNTVAPSAESWARGALKILPSPRRRICAGWVRSASKSAVSSAAACTGRGS